MKFIKSENEFKSFLLQKWTREKICQPDKNYILSQMMSSVLEEKIVVPSASADQREKVGIQDW